MDQSLLRLCGNTKKKERNNMKKKQGLIAFGLALLLEKWRDSAAIEAHNASDNMVKLKATKAKYGLETKIERYE